jgi:hypothetical protein
MVGSSGFGTKAAGFEFSELTSNCYVSATKPNRLMLFRGIIAVYCEIHTEHTNTLCGQNAMNLMSKRMVHIVTTVL